MAALGIGWPVLSVWHPAVGFSSHSKDCWYSTGTRGETPTINFRPPLQGPYRLLSCPSSLFSAGLYHLPLECSVYLTPACASQHSALARWPIPGSFLHLGLCLAKGRLFCNLSSFEVEHLQIWFSKSTNLVDCSSPIISLLYWATLLATAYSQTNVLFPHGANNDVPYAPSFLQWAAATSRKREGDLW